jgi:hypothetical protein
MATWLRLTSDIRGWSLEDTGQTNRVVRGMAKSRWSVSLDDVLPRENVEDTGLAVPIPP